MRFGIRGDVCFLMFLAASCCSWALDGTVLLTSKQPLGIVTLAKTYEKTAILTRIDYNIIAPAELYTVKTIRLHTENTKDNCSKKSTRL